MNMKIINSLLGGDPASQEQQAEDGWRAAIGRYDDDFRGAADPSRRRRGHGGPANGLPSLPAVVPTTGVGKLIGDASSVPGLTGAAPTVGVGKLIGDASSVPGLTGPASDASTGGLATIRDALGIAPSSSGVGRAIGDASSVRELTAGGRTTDLSAPASRTPVRRPRLLDGGGDNGSADLTAL